MIVMPLPGAGQRRGAAAERHPGWADQTRLQWLDDDIHKGKWLDGRELDYVVISGDMTHQGSAARFRQMTDSLLRQNASEM